MSLYDVTYSSELPNWLPVAKRKPKILTLLSAFLYPVQWLHDNFFTEYVQGSAAGVYNSGTTYAVGDKVIDTDNGVYQCILISLNHAPATSPTYWIQVCADYRGVYERINYNGQKLMLEYILNKFFRTNFIQPPNPPYSDIYITRNSLNNNVFIAQDDPTLASAVYGSDSFTQNFVFDTYSFSAYAFTIYIKLAQHTVLQPSADDKIKAVADRYVMAGVQYNILTY